VRACEPPETRDEHTVSRDGSAQRVLQHFWDGT
jgi:hypothetical protein